MPTLPLVVALMVRVVGFPDVPPIQFERYATEKECRVAKKELDSSTLVTLILTCEVDT